MIKILIDTNILIPLEPTAHDQAKINTERAVELQRLATTIGAQLWLHPAQLIDIENDHDEARKRVFRMLARKYPQLEIPALTTPFEPTNDWVDEQLIKSLETYAVNSLVTEDRHLYSRAQKRVNTDRVLTLQEAIESLHALVPERPRALHNIEKDVAYNVNFRDPFWQSFRDDYPDFDVWTEKCRLQHRVVWKIMDDASGRLAGCAIVNHETEEPFGNKTLKICSFKVGTQYGGRKFGELLMRAVFQYAHSNGYDSLLITAYLRHAPLIGLLESLGFEDLGPRRDSDEHIFRRMLQRTFPDQGQPDPFEYFLRNGPFVADIESVDHYIVPILPEFHSSLFPELHVQAPLFSMSNSFGNALRKAYLSSSNIEPPRPGSLLHFYRSHDQQSVTTWGVVEHCIRSDSAEEICSFVLPRTVYTKEQVELRCANGPILAILFHQGLREFKHCIPLEVLQHNSVVKAAPQSIQKVSEQGKQWLVSIMRNLP